MMKSTAIISLIMVMIAPPLYADDLSSVAMGKKDGCMKGPMAEFGRYIGNWNIHARRLSQDGQTWTESDGTKWNFKCVGNGIAIQDFWLPPTGNAGTNLRIYNADTESWDIAWTATLTPGMARINAKKMSDGNIVMHYVSKINPPRRITFFPPDENGWHWQLEISNDNEKTWKKVLELTATPQE